MPKITVTENGQSLALEDHIWFTYDVCIVSVESQANSA
jgi:hypothetical protein